MAKNVKEAVEPQSAFSEQLERDSSSSGEEAVLGRPRAPSNSSNCVDVIEGLVLQQMGVVWRKGGNGSPRSPTDSSETDQDQEQDGDVDVDHDEVDKGHGAQAGHSRYSRRRNSLPSPPPPADLPVPMTIDTCEDLWTRLHDIRIHGSMLEYVGRGKSIYDNGLAQSNTPLTPLNHYFEVTIVNPGESCYIAIGLARKDYPVHKHPGWNRGSIAYHADDGKIFIGSGVGTPFGPRCSLNDILGCGIVFPSKMNASAAVAKAASSGRGGRAEWPWESDVGGSPAKKAPRSRPRPPRGYHMDNILDASSESEDDIWWNNRNQVYEDKVQVFFMRNGKLLGMKEIRIPKGGFYPTIGMMSQNEKIMIDMNPLSG